MDIDPNDNAMNMTYVIFDFETTGLSAEKDAIIEIGAVKIKQGREEGSFQSMVNPLRPIPSQASAINNIHDKDVANAPTIDEIFPEFARFINKSILVAHNASFDSRFLSAVLKRFRIGDLENYVMDTLSLSHKIFPQFSDHSLKALCQRFHLTNENSHRAYDDAKVTAKIFVEFLLKLNSEGHRSFRQVATHHGLPLGRIKGSLNGQSLQAYFENMSSSLF